MFVTDDVAVVDEWNHVGDGGREQIGTVAEQRADIKHAAILFGVAPVNVRLRKLVHRHLAELEDEPHGMAETIRIVQQRIEFFGGEWAVLLMRYDGLRDEMLAQALLATNEMMIVD